MKNEKHFKVELEDQDQDLLHFTVNSLGQILDAGPFHAELYKGGVIPIELQKIGDLCMIHHPPHYNYGFLKYKVTSIKAITVLVAFVFITLLSSCNTNTVIVWTIRDIVGISILALIVTLISLYIIYDGIVQFFKKRK